MRILILLVMLLTSCTKKPPLNIARPLAKVTVTNPIIKDISLYKEYIGHVQANQSVQIKTQVSSTVTTQHFLEGQEVQAGELLISLDPKPFQIALNKAEADLEQLDISLKQAKEKLYSNEKLLDKNYISKLGFNRLKADVDIIEAQVKHAQADVEIAKLNLEYCSLRSPIQGVSSRLEKTVGNFVEIGNAFPLTTIHQVTPIKVGFYIPEQEFSNIIQKHRSNALKTEIYFNDDKSLGELFYIDNQIDTSTGAIFVQAQSANSEKKLWPGAFVRIRLIVETVKDGLLLPSQAIKIGPEGPYVYIVKPDKSLELRAVKTGQKEDQYVLILEGVTSEETVVLTGHINLNPNAFVEIKS